MQCVCVDETATITLAIGLGRHGSTEIAATVLAGLIKDRLSNSLDHYGFTVLKVQEGPYDCPCHLEVRRPGAIGTHRAVLPNHRHTSRPSNAR